MPLILHGCSLELYKAMLRGQTCLTRVLDAALPYLDWKQDEYGADFTSLGARVCSCKRV